MELPKMVWMKIDLKNKELPTAIADSAKELADMCGVSETTVVSAASRAAHGYKNRYVKVWIGD